MSAGDGFGSPKDAAPEQGPERVLPVNKDANSDPHQITFSISRVVLRRVRHVVFYALLAYAGMLTLPLIFSGSATGLDPSGSYAINHFAASEYKYGPDIIFNFGPLGFVCWPENVGGTLPVGLVLRVLVWALLLTELVISYRRTRSTTLPSFLAVSSVIVAAPVLHFLFDYLLASAAMLLIVRDHPEAPRFFRNALPLSLVMSLAFLDKASVYMMMMPAFLLYYGLTYWRERSIPTGASLRRLGWVVAAPFFAYLVYNPSLKGLYQYVAGTVQVMGGYSEGMSSLGLPPDYRRLGTFVVLAIGFGVYAVLRRWLKVEVFACVTMAFFVGVKHGIVYFDHEVFIYGFGFVLFSILVLKSGGEPKAASVVGSIVWVLVCCLSLAGINDRFKTFSLQRWSPAVQIAQIGKVLHWNQTIALVEEQTDVNLSPDTLPNEMLTHIQGAPVVVFPWELSYGPANGLRLIPLYTLQAYLAYTSALDRATAAHLAKTPPDTRILFEWKSLQDRHPLLDVPATWDVMSQEFEGELAMHNLLLLKKRQHAESFKSNIIRRGMSDIRQWQNVPESRNAVLTSVSFSRSLLGTARGILYKVNPIYMELETDAGQPFHFRVIPDVLQHRFVINCLPLNEDGLEALVLGHVCEEKVTRFRFSGPGLSAFSPTAEIAFWEAAGGPLQYAGNTPIDLMNGAHAVSYGGQFLLRGARLVPKHNGIRLELDWQCLREQPLKYMIFVHLLNDESKIVSQADRQQATATRTAVKAGESWRDAIQLTRTQLMGVTKIGIGIWQPPGTFLFADSGNRDWENRRLLLDMPSAVRFGDKFDVTSFTVQKGEGTTIQLDWKTLQRPDKDYSISVHALYLGNSDLFRLDHPLTNRKGSTTRSWVAEETVLDSFPLPCRPNMPNGPYALRIGIYDSNTKEALPVKQTTLDQPWDEWRGQSVIIPNVSCK